MLDVITKQKKVSHMKKLKKHKYSSSLLSFLSFLVFLLKFFLTVQYYCTVREISWKFPGFHPVDSVKDVPESRY